MKDRKYRKSAWIWCQLLAVAVAALTIVGCVEKTDVIQSSYQIADALIKQLDPRDKRSDSPIVVASFVSIDNLEKSSTFGRALAEYIGSRFVQSGFKVVELKLRDTVYIKQDGGEFLLSREVKNLSAEHEVNALVVGTYSLADDTVYLAARVVDPSDATILATYDYSLKIGSNLAQMLGRR